MNIDSVVGLLANDIAPSGVVQYVVLKDCYSTINSIDIYWKSVREKAITSNIFITKKSSLLSQKYTECVQAL